MHAIDSDSECIIPVCLLKTGHGMLVMGSQHPAGLASALTQHASTLLEPVEHICHTSACNVPAGL